MTDSYKRFRKPDIMAQEYHIKTRDKDKILKKATKKKFPQKQKSYFKMDKISEQAHYKADIPVKISI